MSAPRLISPAMRRVLLLGMNQAARHALRAPTRRTVADAVLDASAAHREIACLICCLRHRNPKGRRR
jgi:hypothetical protein